MRVTVTDTQGINETNDIPVRATKSGPLALPKRAGHMPVKALAGAAWTKPNKTRGTKAVQGSFDRSAHMRAIFHELRLLQSQGAQFVFEARHTGDFSAPGRDKGKMVKGSEQASQPSVQAKAPSVEAQETDHFSLLKLADFLILGQGGKTLLLKINQKKGGQAFRSSWHTRLMTLGHAIAYLECETPLDGREQLRKLMHRHGYINDAPKATAKAKAQALFS